MKKTNKSKALERLRRALEEIPNLKRLKSGSPEFEKWHRNTEVATANTFGEKSRHVNDFTSIPYSLMVISSTTPDSAFQRAYVDGLESASSVLQSMIEEIEEYWEDEMDKSELLQPCDSVAEFTDDIFIIHGRDNGVKDMVARFITTIGLNPIILHELPNQGRTIIEKFERHADVGFAIALLTPDDLGTLYGNKNNLQPRARQNVIFEFGYFMGRLGRNRVCALTKSNIEILSNYAGVLYIPLDVSGAWKINLVRELKAVGYNIDANLVL